jgi:prepilin-type N-terminal cleavage/methylation domain-containing protein
MQDKKFFRNGFTIIELLVAVLITSILAAVALPKYLVAVKKAQFAKLLVLQTALYNAEKKYFLTNGTYTADSNSLDVQIPEINDYTIILYTGNSSAICIHGSLSSCRYLDKPRWDCRTPKDHKILGKFCQSLGAVYNHNDGMTDMYYF